MGTIGTVYADVMKAAGATSRIFEIIDSKPDPTATPIYETERLIDTSRPAGEKSAGFLFESLRTPPVLNSLLRSVPMEADGASERVFTAEAVPADDSHLAGFSTGLVAASDEAFIDFDRVYFRYSNRKGSPILENLSLQVPKGGFISVCGTSGSGKSTIASLLLRLYDPDYGEVRIGGKPLREMDTKTLRRHVVLVPQDTSLFSGTILENIVYGLSDVDDERFKLASSIAGVDAFSSSRTSFPDGVDTKVGDRGSQLSGGQRQRIALARAVLRMPSVLVLDEATAALDLWSERIVLQGLKQLQEQGTTIVSIAHRPTTIQAADSVVVLDEGSVAQRGSFEELKDAEGPLNRLLKDPRLRSRLR
eukprot:scaffold63_cov306-Pinguiococcus_pyrenoidosus.AAC.26